MRPKHLIASITIMFPLLLAGLCLRAAIPFSTVDRPVVGAEVVGGFGDVNDYSDELQHIQIDLEAPTSQFLIAGVPAWLLARIRPAAELDS